MGLCWSPSGPLWGPAVSSQVAVSDVFSVHGGVFFPQGLHDTLTGLDVGLEDLCRFSVYLWRLNFIDVVLRES